MSVSKAIKRWLPKIGDMVLARAKAKSQLSPVNIFAPAQHPPGVTPPKGAKLAMDEYPVSTAGWAYNNIGANIIEEGQGFLGYAVLAQLSQRAEYRSMVEILAMYMTKEWINLKTSGNESKSDKIATIASELEHLKIKKAFQTVAEQDGYFGRGHLYLDLGETTEEERKKSILDSNGKVSAAKVGRGSFKRVKAIEAVWAYPIRYNSTDPFAADWYKPQAWYVMGKEVHVSRFLTFIGREVSDLLKPAYSFGGLSLTQMALPYVDNWLRTRQSVSDIVHAFSVMVLSTNLSEALQADGEQLFRRVDLFNGVRDNKGVLVLDKETEVFQNVSAPLSGLDTLLSQSQEQLCSVAGTPVIILLGLSPHGLNASSEGEIRAFFDRIKSRQESLFRDPLERLIDIIQLSKFGEVDPDITFDFVDLWSLDEKGRVDVEKTKADLAQVLIDAGVIAPEEERSRLAKDPDSFYHGLNIDDAPDLKEEEEDGLELRGGAGTGDDGGDDVISGLFDRLRSPRHDRKEAGAEA